MSTSGLTNQYIPNTLDGLNVIEADQIYINGQAVDIDNLVPYTGATKTINVGSQAIKTSHAPVANEDVVNLITLQNAVTFVDTSIALTYLNKITSSPQTVAGPVTFQSGITTTAEKDSNLSGKVVIAPNYQNLAISDASINVVNGWGTITNSGGIYQSTGTNLNTTMAVLSAFPITNGKQYRFQLNTLVNDSSYATYLEAFQTNDFTSKLSIPLTHTFPANTTNFEFFEVTFTAITSGHLCLTVNTDNPSETATLQWYGLKVFSQGVALSHVTMPALTSDRVLVVNDQYQVVSSGINTEKLGYLDNVSSDIQTQLNDKASLTLANTFTGSNQFQQGTSSVTGITSFKNPNLCDADIGYELNASYTSGALTKRLGRISFLRNASGTSDYSSKVILNCSTDGALYKAMLTLHPTNGVSAGANKITTTYVPVNGEDVTNKTYVDGAISGIGSLYLPLAGGTMTGPIDMTSSSISGGLYTQAGLTNVDYVHRLRSGANHYNGTISNTYMFNGVSGEIMLSYSTTRDATTANLLLGAPNTDISEIVSISGDGSTYLPLNFGSTLYSLYTPSKAYADRASNPSKAQVRIVNSVNGQRLLFGTYYTAGAGSCATIQASDYYSSVDNGNTLLINTIGGNVGIGSCINGIYYDANCKFTINADYSAGDAGGFCINATDSASSPNRYNLRIYPYVQSGGNVAYQFKTYNGSTAYDAFTIRSTGEIYTQKAFRTDQGAITANDPGQNALAGYSGFTYGGGNSSSGYWIGIDSGGNTWCQSLAPSVSWRTFNARAYEFYWRPSGGGSFEISNGGNVGIGGNSSGKLNIWNPSAGPLGGQVTHFGWTDNCNYIRGNDTYMDTQLRCGRDVYYNNPPAQYRGASAGYGALLGWDVIDKKVTANVVEYYHSGPYNNLLQGNWNGMNRTSQFYKSSLYQCLLIIGFATAYTSSTNFMEFRIRLYNQSTGQYFYYYTFQFYNVTYNHCPININIDCGQLPAGWYDVYTYYTYGNEITDSNDVISLTYQLWPNGLTSG